MILTLIFLSVFLINIQEGYSQQGYSYKEYMRSVCLDTQRAYSKIPEDVHFVVTRGDEMFYAIYSDPEWFDEFFSEEGRSLSVQLVSTDYFDCDKSIARNKDSYFYHLPPVSYRQMKSNQFSTETGLYATPLVSIPEEMIDKPFDIGIIISRRGRICLDHWYSWLPRHDWELLETALMIDTLQYLADIHQLKPDSVIISDTRMELEILFEKNQTQFDKSKLRDFMYSIPITRYSQISIVITAFASIEGPEERNQELYWERARGVFREMNAFLPENIIYEFEVAENWDEFMNDISGTPYAYLAEKDKDEIRELLKDQKFSEKMEPILKNHRKAKVSITLENKIFPGKSSLDDLFQFYKKTLGVSDAENALKIQDAIFTLIQKENVSGSFPDSLPIPEGKEFSFVFNRDYSYRYAIGLTDTRKAYMLFKKLQIHFPDDPNIKFNTTELMFRSWLLNDTTITAAGMLNAINDLSKAGVPAGAFQRLLVNYHKIMVLQSMENKDARLRNRSLNAIRSLYAGTWMNETELVSLSMFFTAYHRRDLAERLLRPMARSAQPQEDLLFYYISLTINNKSLTRQRWYGQMLRDAYHMNSERYCNLFQPVGKSGSIGISNLFDENLWVLYCTMCINTNRNLK
jgi:hypothetical protein